jgi:hypothetical protein
MPNQFRRVNWLDAEAIIPYKCFGLKAKFNKKWLDSKAELK